MAKDAKTKLDTKIIHSLDKGLEVLELVATSDGDISLSELTQQLRWDKSTTFRLLTTLIRRGYIEQDRDSKYYRLGFRILHLEDQLFRSLDLPRLSRDVLTQLARTTGEAAHLAALHQDQAIIVAQCEGPGRVAVNAHVGTIEPIHCTALGKAMLMQVPHEVLQSVIASIEFKAYTPNTITSPEWLFKHVEKARSVGYALDEEEFHPEVRCIAAPLVVPGSRQHYAVGISGPSARLAAGRMPALIDQVLKAARELSSRFGTEVSTRKAK